MVKSKDIKLGDFIKINQGDRIPADVIIIFSADEVLIKTDQLDGETDLKKRKALRYTNTNNKFMSINGKVNYDFPSKNLYEFKGKNVLKHRSI